MISVTFLLGFAFILEPVRSSSHEDAKRRRIDVPETIASMDTTTSSPTTTLPAPTGRKSILNSHALPYMVVPGVNITNITARGRFVESYDFEVIHAISGQDDIRSQQAEDELNDMYTPATGAYMRKISTPFGELTLDQRIARSTLATVYTLRERPDLLAKFQADCDEILSFSIPSDPFAHPLIYDYRYGREAARRNLSMEPVFLSPPAALCPVMEGVCGFDGISIPEFDECRSTGGSLRFMLIKKSTGFSLDSTASRFGGRIPFEYTMSIGATMMQMLRRLHTEARVVHGDIHDGNVFIQVNADGQYGLKFIDFGKASRVVDPWPETPRIIDPDLIHYMYTQWIIEGHYTTPRDDVMKTIQMLAQLMHNSFIYRAMEKQYMRAGRLVQRQFKMQHDIFSPEVPWNGFRRFDVIKDLPVSEDNKLEIRRELADVLRIVRGLNSTNSVIPYDSLMESFRRCKHLAKPSATTTAPN